MINPIGMGPLGSKSPSLQSSLQSNMPNNIGMAMSIANGTQQPMNSMQQG